MRTSQRGIDLIKEFEGFCPIVYRCPGGVYTIGYGHTRGVELGDICTKEEAEQYLKEDLRDAEEMVEHLVKVPLKQHQFDALVSLIYNIGAGNFYSSTIREVINSQSKDIEEYRKAWMMWVKSKKKVLKGLIRRRTAEFELFCDC
jgi:lysozyme